MKKPIKIEEYKSQVDKIKNERERLSERLRKMKIAENVYPSDSNFLLVKVNNATSIYNTLVTKNIVVRNRSNIIDNCLRITVGTRTENNELLKALNSISI